MLVTDGDTKSYAIFTYKCGTLGWSEEAIVGYNAAGDYYMNHPLSGLYLTQSIACVHNDSVWNNVIYDLVPNPALLTTDPTPEPLLTIGGCAKTVVIAPNHMGSWYVTVIAASCPLGVTWLLLCTYVRRENVDTLWCSQ